MAVVSGDAEKIADGNSYPSEISNILRGVSENLKRSEQRLAPTGSTRTDLRILCSLVNNI